MEKKKLGGRLPGGGRGFLQAKNSSGIPAPKKRQENVPKAEIAVSRDLKKKKESMSVGVKGRGDRASNSDQERGRSREASSDRSSVQRERGRAMKREGVLPGWCEAREGPFISLAVTEKKSVWCPEFWGKPFSACKTELGGRELGGCS